jgi:predicted amidohydrolase YtcJ
VTSDERIPTIYPAATVRTVDDDRLAEAVAVDEDGRIAGVGDLADLTRQFPEAAVDRRYEDAVIVPGFIEAHCHVLEGALWGFPYLGYFGRIAPDGVEWPGVTSLDDAIERLAELEGAMPPGNEPLVAWGFDPIYLDDDRLVATHLDRVSTERPILVFHASGHLATVNTAMLELEGIGRHFEFEGVPLDADGMPTGELQEPAAMALAMTGFRPIIKAFGDPEAIRRLGASARRSGCTTVTELGASRLDQEPVVEAWQTVVNDETFPARVVVMQNPTNLVGPVDETVRMLHELATTSSAKLRLGSVKMLLDGSIQGFTARLNPPGYVGDRPNGIWLVTPERFAELFRALHGARINVHVHCNGDQAVDLFLDTLEPIIADDDGWPDHRHTVQHCQLTTREQYERMAAIGVNANLFTNHLYYWGDQHRALTVGPERAARMDACALADETGVRYSIHSDASVTPLGHLMTMWCAVNRRTATGSTLGPDQRISPERALRAATIDAAHQLHIDDDVGSIAIGKFADFTILDADPVTVDPLSIKDLTIIGTMLAGVPTA